jgi:prepilin-type N-terminal cleavage/methylation domain-containing protein
MLLYHYFPMARFHLVQGRMRGFTLVEIAFVIVIAGILLAMVIGATASIVESSRLRLTRTNMDTARSALQAFIARNGRLPCPAIEDRAPAANDYGLEAATPGTCTGTVNLPGQAGPPVIDAAKRGVLPWKSLGMTLENATDGWGNQLTYMVTVTATGKNFDTVAGMRGSLYVHGATPVAAGLPPTGNQINACSTTANDNACNRAAVAVLISHGRNVLGAYPPSGVRATPLPTDAAELENTDADRFVVSADISQTFDDLVLPIEPDGLLAPLAAQGAIKSERALLQDRARQVVIQMIGESVPARTGTSPNISYPVPAPAGGLANYTFETGRFNASCDAPFNSAGVVTAVSVGDTSGDALQIVDPWNNTFKFARASLTITSAESCKTPVAIISRGPDGTLGTADDYVYYSPMADWKDVLGKTGW